MDSEDGPPAAAATLSGSSGELPEATKDTDTTAILLTLPTLPPTTEPPQLPQPDQDTSNVKSEQPPVPESGQASENVSGNDIPAMETVGGDTDEFADFDRIPKRKVKKKSKKAKETPTEEASTPTSTALDEDSSAPGQTKSQEELRAIWKIEQRLCLDEYVLRCGEEGRLQPGMQQRFDQLLQDRSSGEWQAEERVGPSQPPPKDDQDIQPTTSATEDC